MQLNISRTELARVVGAVGKVVETRNTIPILSNILLEAEGSALKVTGTDLDIQATTTADAVISKPGRITVGAKLLSDIVRKAAGDTIALELKDGRLNVKAGRSNFKLETLPAEDYPDLTNGTYAAEFEIDLATLFAPVTFAISTEETRHYLNGVYFHVVDGVGVAVATDGHRLARNRGSELPDFTGVIIPRKTVGLLPKGAVTVAVSDTKIRIQSVDLTLVSKLIEGTFPDYVRVIPRDNDKVVTVNRDDMMKAADRVTSVSTERGRSVKLSIAPGGISHCMQLPTSKRRNGFIGMRDFRGEIIRAYEDAGWIFHSEVCIWKDPVVAQQRTKSIRLLHKQIQKDSCISGQGLADYIVSFRKPGDNPEPVDGMFDCWVGDESLDISREAYDRHAAETIADGRTPWSFEQWRSVFVWQRYASPVWSDIRQTRTLQYRSARDEQDEQHISPLQLDVIERCIDLWSLPGETVLTPFLGIGSEVYSAVEMGRKGVGFELKPSYFRQAVKNIASLGTKEQPIADLFSAANDNQPARAAA